MQGREQRRPDHPQPHGTHIYQVFRLTFRANVCR